VRSGWPVYVVVGMETIGFGTRAAGDAAEGVIGGTDNVEDIDNGDRLDVPVDELELESGSGFFDEPIVITYSC
jgi:hypothetical protein